MELKLIDDNGEKTATVAASDALFGRDYNEALVHQVVTRTRRTRGRARARRRAAATSTSRTRSRGRRRAPAARARARRTARCGAAAARSSRTRPTRISRTRSTARCIAPGIASILSQLVREDRLSVVETLALDAPKTKALRAEDQGIGLDRHRADRHRQARREPVPVVAQPARRARARDARESIR